jgi:hypothetical protein
VPTWVLGVLGALIAIVKGVQQLNQYHADWISYRSTCEALKHEKFLYLAKAGPYAVATDPRVLLAERIEALLRDVSRRSACQLIEGLPEDNLFPMSIAMR